MAHEYDVYGVGNAIVDTEVEVEDSFLTGHSMEKGIMTLVSPESQAVLLRSLAGHASHGSAGGSASNTMTAVSHFGGRAFFTGKVGDDMHGALYRESLAEAGVEFDVAPADSGPTGACVILVTPDGERTMQTSLGAASTLEPDDIDLDALRSSRIVYVEGYLLTTSSCAEAAERAMTAASDAGVRVALSLSDPAIAAHFIEGFRRVTRRYVDILFCNEHEAEIYGGGGSREERLRAVGADVPLVFMTCGADGALVFDAGAGPARFIVNVPTKRHWRGKSRMADIETGLDALAQEIKQRNIRSIALPPLGSGLGGLDWPSVRSRIESKLQVIDDCRVVLFEPFGLPADVRPNRSTNVPRMTTGRAVLVNLMHRYLGELEWPAVSGALRTVVYGDATHTSGL
jgi:sugar/nucleoside kinase (ribokinase family)